MRTSARTMALAAVAAAIVACGSPTAAGGAAVPSGAWGGQHITLAVTGSGATVQFDCAHGSIGEPMTVDANGHCAVAGTFVRQRGGPTRSDGSETPEAARYSGTLKGDTLTVTVELVDSQETVGVFTLTRGGSGKLTKCL